jgi:putative flippase GtrA
VQKLIVASGGDVVTCPSLLTRRPAVGDAVGSVVARVRGEDTLAQFTRFVLVGASTTLVYAALFATLEGLGYLPAHLMATAVSTVLANEMHRRLTFRAGERVHWLTAQVEAGGVTLIGLLLSSAALGVLDSFAPDASVVAQVSLVVTVTGLVGLMRFVALRWLFRPRAASTA